VVPGAHRAALDRHRRTARTGRRAIAARWSSTVPWR